MFQKYCNIIFTLVNLHNQFNIKINYSSWTTFTIVLHHKGIQDVGNNRLFIIGIY